MRIQTRASWIVIGCFIALLPCIAACHKDNGGANPAAQDLGTQSGAPVDLGVAAADLATTGGGTVDLGHGSAAVDLASGSAAHVCASTSGSCPNSGVTCGTACCPGGEWCDAKTLTCQCGDSAGCGAQFICIALAGSTCGETCQPIF